MIAVLLQTVNTQEITIYFIRNFARNIGKLNMYLYCNVYYKKYGKFLGLIYKYGQYGNF